MMRGLIERMILQTLRRTFRRVVWTSDPLDPDPARPVVLYANHQVHHDGYLLWLLLRTMRRRTVTWMAEWDRFPLFAPVGARPFPSDDPVRRAATVRATARDFRRNPASGLIYFPEGRLHGSGEPLLPFDAAPLGRLHAVLGEPLWIPVGIRIVWGAESRPTALLGGGPASVRPDGREHARLADVLETLPPSPDAAGHVLLEGRRGPDERMDLHRLRSFFARYL